MIDLEKIIYASILSNGGSTDPTITTKTGSLSTASANSFVIIPESFENLYAVELEIDGSLELSIFANNDIIYAFGLQCTNKPITLNGTEIIEADSFFSEGIRKTSSSLNAALCAVQEHDGTIRVSSSTASYTFPPSTYTYKLYYKS